MPADQVDALAALLYHTEGQSRGVGKMPWARLWKAAQEQYREQARLLMAAGVAYEEKVIAK